MDSPIALLETRVAAIEVSYASGPSSSLGEIEGMSDVGVVDAARELADLSRRVDILRLHIAGEVADRSRTSLGNDGLAKRAAYARPALMLAALWGITVAESCRLCDVGLAIRARQTIGGEPLPPRYPSVAAGIENAVIGVATAAVIIRQLEAVSLRCSADAREDAEAQLVALAHDYTVEEMVRFARLVRDRLDQDGAEPRDELHRRRRSLTIRTTSDGMIHVDWYLPPESGGLVKAGIDALVGAELRQSREDGSTDSSCELVDDRSLPQLRSDAAAEIFRHAATCVGSGGQLPAFTMVVRMDLDSLITGLGTAEIDGIDETISATTARMLAAEAELIPIVLGGRGEVLDLGMSRRLFTKAQKLAFGERDGGCAFGGCSSVPSYAEAHHIDWWSHLGPSDLDNGILLCSHHHHQIHDFGWEIEIREGVPYFLPPPHVDPYRQARRGGRIALAA
ncbi:DUF222 domain-containing protein [Glaciihabitans sp. UYNi722]|uniref:HNH endonuclease signature motif containing protein n=1 Tax=Glaciihabitans sp. UYNi722 TaxID=3156344 RepID=UPI003398D4BF